MNHDDTQLLQPMMDRRMHQEKQLPCAENAKALADHGQRLALTEQAVMSLKLTNEGMTTKLDLILAQITRVAVLEEKHSTQAQDITRAHTKIEANSDKLDALAEESRAFMSYTKGQNTVLWAIGSVVFALFIKVLFFTASHGMTP